MSAYMSEFVSFNVLDPDYIKDKVDDEEQQKDIQLEQIELQVHTDEEVDSITNEEIERERERNLSDIETKFLEVVDKIVEQEKEQIIPDKKEERVD